MPYFHHAITQWWYCIIFQNKHNRQVIVHFFFVFFFLSNKKTQSSYFLPNIFLMIHPNIKLYLFCLCYIKTFFFSLFIKWLLFVKWTHIYIQSLVCINNIVSITTRMTVREKWAHANQNTKTERKTPEKYCSILGYYL